MANETAPNLEGRPKLQSFVRLQHDKARERWVLQAPERVLVLDEIGKEIVALCDGERSIARIVDLLSADYDAPRNLIARDVDAVLNLLSDKGVLVII